MPTSGSGSPSDTPAVQYWFLSQAFKNYESYAAFDSLLQPARQIQNSDIRQWSAEEPFDEDFVHCPSTMSFMASGSWTLEELSEERRSLDPSPTAKIDDTIDYDYLAVSHISLRYEPS